MARKKSTVSNRIQNASFTSYSGGQLGDGDRGSYHMLPNYTGNPYDSNDYIFRWRQYCHLYEISWEARKIIRIPIEDAMRKDWEVKGIEEAKANQIKTRLDQLGFKLSLMRAMILERLLGGCLQFFGIEDNRDEPKREYLPRNGYRTRFINTVPISRIARVDWGTDPLKADYMRPEKFLVNGVQVHTSRCLVWDGEPLFDPYDFALTNFRSNISGFGPSKLAPIWDDIVRATGIRQAAFQMAQMNNSIIAALEGYQDLRGTVPGQNKISDIKKLVNELSVYKAAILDKGKVDVTTLAASFGSVPEMMITSLQILSAASDIPATRFIGQAPGGLNATGESDLENYYNVIDAIQKQRMEPRLRKTYDIIGWQMFPNSWAEDRKKLEFEFPPLWNLSELEEADRTSKIIDNMAKLLENRLITEEKAIEELTKKNVVGVTLDDMDMSSLKDTGLFDEQPNANPKESIEKLKQFPVKNSNPESLLIVAAGGKPEDFDARQFKMGMEVEKEHKDVTHGDEVETAKIVLAHLREKPDYYTRLQKVENKIDLDPLPEPSQKQIESGNYKKHHLKLYGFDISIENPKGSRRSGIDPNGEAWSVKMPAHYGYIKRSEGADGDHIDIYIGPNENSQKVFVIDQTDLSGNFDEHKCFLGCNNKEQAEKLYLKGFSDGKGNLRLGRMIETDIDGFKEWLSNGDQTKRFAEYF